MAIEVKFDISKLLIMQELSELLKTYFKEQVFVLESLSVKRRVDSM